MECSRSERYIKWPSFHFICLWIISIIFYTKLLPFLDNSPWLDQLISPHCFYYSSASNDEDIINAQVVVSYDGTTIYIVSGMITSTCAFNYKNYPYDQHTCMLKFGPWLYDHTQVMWFIPKSSLECYRGVSRKCLILRLYDEICTNSVYKVCSTPSSSWNYVVILVSQ